MKNRIKRILVITCLSVAFASQVAARDESMDSQVLAEINLARTKPLKFAGFLREFRNHFQGKRFRTPGSDTMTRTSEGVAAVDEAIRFLSRQKPLPPLAWSPGLAAAADELAQEQGESGATGHNGVRTRGMRERIERHGTWQEQICENIAYGPSDPRSMVMQLLIDDGVPSRGHRKNQFNPGIGTAGVACGPHPHYGSMCVIDFAGRFRE